MRSTLKVAVLGLLACHGVQAATLIHNVNGYTMDEGRRAEFTALEYEDGVVTAVYSDAASAEASTAETRIDGAGATMLPGLIDAHGHVEYLGQALASVDLTSARSELEAARRVAAWTKREPGDGWLVGNGWNQVLWEGGEFPTRTSLDALVPDRPVALSRVDVHALWVNSRALELAGIDADTPDPEGGMIVRDEKGEPTGILIDNAMGLVQAAQPANSDETIRANILRATRYLARLGMTGVHDAGVSDATMRVYESINREGGLPIRVSVMLSTTDEANKARLDAGPETYPGGRLTARAVKVFADGALGSRGAALINDYSDAPGSRGLLLQSAEELRATMRGAAKSGFQVNVHAIGDLANKRVLDEFEVINSDPEQRALRHRIEHAQILRLSDFARFEELDVIASVQPTHATSDKNMAGARLGPDRLAGAYAWQTFIATGARMTGGSDFPVEPANPFYGLHAAVTRQDREGDPPGGWRVDQALSREQALSLFTEYAAYSGHAEDRVGRLAPGYAADYILVADDFFEMPAGSIWRSRVLKTVVDGEVVYQAP